MDERHEFDGVDEIEICAWRVSRDYPRTHESPRMWRGGPVGVRYWEASSLAELRRIAREALAREWGWSPTRAKALRIRIRFSLPDPVREALAARDAATAALERAEAAARAATAAAIREVISVEDVSFRDAAEILGLSAARLEQLFRANRLGRVRAFLRSQRRERLRFIYEAERFLRQFTPSALRGSPADA